jgi:hypothetical protein
MEMEKEINELVERICFCSGVPILVYITKILLSSVLDSEVPF